MLGRPPAAAVMSASFTHPHTALQHHEDLAAAAAAADLDSYEVLSFTAGIF